MHTPRRGDAEVAGLLHEAAATALHARRDRQRGRLPAARARRAAAARRPARLLLDLGEVEALTRGPAAAKHLREAYARPDRLQAAGARGATRSARALLFTRRPPRAPRSRARAARDLPPGAGTRRSALGAFALMGVPFGALEDPSAEELRARGATRELTHVGEKGMGADAALEWTQRRARRTSCAGCALRALEGGELSARRQPADARRCCR